MDFLLNHLVFLGPITTSLPLITFRAYWPLSQPNEFTNSFLELPRPIYFLITSYCSHGFTTSFIGLPCPIYFLFTSFYSCGLASCQSYHSDLLGMLYFSSHFLHIVELLLLLSLLSKVGINTSKNADPSYQIHKEKKEKIKKTKPDVVYLMLLYVNKRLNF